MISIPHVSSIFKGNQRKFSSLGVTSTSAAELMSNWIHLKRWVLLNLQAASLETSAQWNAE